MAYIYIYYIHSMKDSDGMAPFPCPCTVREVLTRHLDINAAPRRAMLVALAEMAQSPEDKVGSYVTTMCESCLVIRER